MTRIILFDPIIVRVANKGGSKVMLNKSKKCVANRDALIAERAPEHHAVKPEREIERAPKHAHQL